MYVPFSPDCIFKICEKPSKFSESVADSLPCPTTRTRCQRSQQPRQHRVGVDNAYSDTVSAKSTTTRTHVFRKDEQFLKTVFACSFGAQVEFFDQKV